MMNCPQCGWQMTKIKDKESRRWWQCPQCGAQIPDYLYTLRKEERGSEET